MAQVPDSDGTLGGARSLTHGREGGGGVGGGAEEESSRGPWQSVLCNTIVVLQTCVSKFAPGSLQSSTMRCASPREDLGENNPVYVFEALAQLTRIRFASVPLVRLGSVTSNPKKMSSKQASKQASMHANMQTRKDGSQQAGQQASKRASQQASKARQQASKR